MTSFKFTKLKLEDAYLIDYFFVGDNRGGFGKSFEKDIYQNAGIPFFVNEVFTSFSSKNVIRGLHFQTHNPQAKLVSVPKGKIYDVIVDLRPDSPTYKQWDGHVLSSENHLAVYIPRGFAHGFLSMEDNTVMLYQCDGPYDAPTDTGIIFNDPDIGIEWPINLEDAIFSQRDLGLMSFSEYERLFNEKLD